MAITDMGIFGDISGRIGNIQASNTRNGNILQSRVISNGRSLTTPAVNGRNKFGSLRSLLSLLRNDFVDFACPVYDKEIGQWASWVKQVYSLAIPSYDWFVDRPIFAKGTSVYSPNVTLEFSIVDAGIRQFAFSQERFDGQPNSNLRTVLYCVASGQIISEVTMTPAYFGIFSLYAFVDRCVGNQYIVFAMFCDFEPSPLFSNGVSRPFVLP